MNKSKEEFDLLKKESEKLLNSNEYSKALNLAKKLYHIAEVNNDQEDIIDIGILLTKIYFYNGNYLEALKIQVRVLELAERLNLKEKILRCYNGLANIYNQQKDYKAVEELYEKIFEIIYALEESDINIDLGVLNNLGMLYTKQKRYHKGIRIFKNILNMMTDTTSKFLNAAVHQSMGQAYVELGNISKAEYYLDKAIQLIEELDSDENKYEILVECYLCYSKLYIAMSDYSKALINAKKAYLLAKEKSLLLAYEKATKYVSIICEKTSDYKEAYNMLVENIDIKNKLYNKENESVMNEIRIKYNSLQKEKEAKIFKEKYIRLKEENKLLEKISMTDSLTAISNRYCIMEMLKTEFEQCIQNNKNLCCILFDIDKFKLINDCHGHLFGDYVIATTAKLISEHIHSKKSIGRFGGDEFLIILPDYSIKDAIVVAESIRNIIANYRYVHNGHQHQVTLSIGIADVNYGNPQNILELINNADKSLYFAKAKGRNRYVTVYDMVKEKKYSVCI